VKGAQKMYEIFEQLLQRRGITAYKVAKDTGLTQTLLSNWKNGKSIPNTQNLKKIADYFGVTVDYLMTGEDKTETKNDFSELEGAYFSLAKEAQESGIDPDDIRKIIEIVRSVRDKKGGVILSSYLTKADLYNYIDLVRMKNNIHFSVYPLNVIKDCLQIGIEVKKESFSTKGLRDIFTFSCH